MRTSACSVRFCGSDQHANIISTKATGIKAIASLDNEIVASA